MWRTTEAAVHSWPWSSGWCLHRSSGWPWCPHRSESRWHTGVRCMRWWSSYPSDAAWLAGPPSSPEPDRNALCCPKPPHTAGPSGCRSCDIHEPSAWVTLLSIRSRWTCSATHRHRGGSHQSHLKRHRYGSSWLEMVRNIMKLHIFAKCINEDSLHLL